MVLGFVVASSLSAKKLTKHLLLLQINDAASSYCKFYIQCFANEEFQRVSNVALQVLTKPDTEGRLLGMIETVADYARESHELDNARIDRCSPC